ncbi:MAG TPA: hypothetical protein VKH81_22960 [Candidatus Angelobacter sp.]|nr:hypothetical protein [Candidatus Angelobacter sp.]
MKAKAKKQRVIREKQTTAETLKAIRECAAELGRTPSFVELKRLKQVSKGAIYQLFGSYRCALEVCGLERSGPGCQADLRALFLDWAGLARSLGKVPSMAEYEARAKFSIQPLLRRYGFWSAVPAEMGEFARKNGLAEEWEDVLEMIEGRRRIVRPAAPEVVKARPRFAEGEPVYGPPLTLSPLAFAPTFEGGVLFLFGALAEELGFAVLRIQPGFPDCEAMREVKPGVWQRVRIEFELQSRNYVTHDHPAGGCEIIVCWTHNWEACPVEVIELRKVVEGWRKRMGR